MSRLISINYTHTLLYPLLLRWVTLSLFPILIHFFTLCCYDESPYLYFQYSYTSVPFAVMMSHPVLISYTHTLLYPLLLWWVALSLLPKLIHFHTLCCYDESPYLYFLYSYTSLHFAIKMSRPISNTYTHTILYPLLLRWVALSLLTILIHFFTLCY